MPGEKNVLIAALPQRGKLPPAVFELAAAGKAAAEILGGSVSAAVFGSKSAEFAKELSARGVGKIYTISAPVLDAFNDELYAKALRALAEKEGHDVILLSSSIAGRSLCARLSVLLKAGAASEICAIEKTASGGMGIKRYQYGGNAIADVAFKSERKILTVQPMVFEAAARQEGTPAQISEFPVDLGSSRIEILSHEAEESSEIDLGAAEKIVSGGRGLGNADGFKLIRELAQTIGAAVGASRAVVDAGWIAYRHQVGLTGRTVHPKLYIACGISGQVQHLAGMASSANIVAVNTDPACPMMQMATLSVTGDVYEVLPEIIAEIKRRRGG
ncbi:MAG: electron transfer flavoprotein subunit alpha/FixB family protein [Elusimicrobiota bacterium]